MAQVPYKAQIPAGLTVKSSPTGIEWGKSSAGVVTIGSLWLGHSRVDAPPWPANGKPYWIEGTYPEYVPEEPEPDPTAPATLYTPAERLEIPLYNEDGAFVGTYRNANEIRWTLV